MTDQAENIVNSYAYMPFGVLAGEDETISNPFRYVGKFGVMDDNSGLLYMRARYYDPDLGRFITKDPIGFGGGVNLYAYVGNNVSNFIDPIGLCPTENDINKDVDFKIAQQAKRFYNRVMRFIDLSGWFTRYGTSYSGFKFGSGKQRGGLERGKVAAWYRAQAYKKLLECGYECPEYYELMKKSREEVDYLK
jgi:RHS repeat-associated protein